jgi:hypothetical protein
MHPTSRQHRCGQATDSNSYGVPQARRFERDKLPIYGRPKARRSLHAVKPGSSRCWHGPLLREWAARDKLLQSDIPCSLGEHLAQPSCNGLAHGHRFGSYGAGHNTLGRGVYVEVAGRHSLIDQRPRQCLEIKSHQSSLTRDIVKRPTEVHRVFFNIDKSGEEFGVGQAHRMTRPTTTRASSRSNDRV